MKVLLFDLNLPYLLSDADYPVGGASIELYAWIHGFIRSNHDVSVITRKDTGKILKNNIEFKLIDEISKSGGIPFLKWLYPTLPQLYKKAKIFNPNIAIQECAGFDTGIMAVLSQLLGVPFIHRIASDVDVDERVKLKLPYYSYYLYKYALRISKAIICQNDYQLSKIRSEYPDKNVFKLYNPFIMPDIHNGINTERKFIAWVGIFHQRKNLQSLLNTVKLSPQYKFKIAGISSKTIDNSTKNVLYELECSRNVEFVGYLPRKKIFQFLKNAYALLITSYFEGFSNVFLEAWSVGTPIITTKNANPDNLINAHNLGVVTDKYDQFPKEVSELILSKKYIELQPSCMNYVKKNHNPVLLVRELMNKIQ